MRGRIEKLALIAVMWIIPFLWAHLCIGFVDWLGQFHPQLAVEAGVFFFVIFYAGVGWSLSNKKVRGEQ